MQDEWWLSFSAFSLPLTNHFDLFGFVSCTVSDLNGECNYAIQQTEFDLQILRTGRLSRRGR